MPCFTSDNIAGTFAVCCLATFFWPTPARALSPLQELSGAYWLPPGQRVSYPAYLAAQWKKRAAVQAQAQAKAQAAAAGAASGAASAFLEACTGALRSLASAGGGAPWAGGSGSGRGGGGGGGHGGGGGDGGGDGDSGAARLRWLLGYTMGSPRAFENRRVEVALLLASDMAHGGGRLSPRSGGGGGGGGGSGGGGNRAPLQAAKAETMTAGRASPGLWVDPLRLAVKAAREAAAEVAAEERGSSSQSSSERISGDACSRGDSGRLGGGSGDVHVAVTDGAVVASFRRSVARGGLVAEVPLPQTHLLQLQLRQQLVECTF